MSKEDQSSEETKKYDKGSSFFDTISNDVTDKAEEDEKKKIGRGNAISVYFCAAVPETWSEG